MTINTPDAVPASLGRLDQYLTQALILAADLRGSTACQLAEAQTVAWVLAAENHALWCVDVPDLDALDLRGCIAAALREVQDWDLLLAAGYPEVSRLCVLLADVHRALAAPNTAGRG